MIPAALIENAIRARVSYVTVGSVLYRVEAVSAAKLATVGLAYLQGIAEARPQLDDDAEAAIRAEYSAEEVPARLAELRKRTAERSMAAHRAVVSTPEGASAFLARARAYVCAGVTGLAVAPEAMVGPAPGVPGMQHHGPDWTPPDGCEVSGARVVDVERVDGESIADALARHAAVDEYPLWAINTEDVGVLAMVIAPLAGGRAGMVAPFRVGSPVRIATKASG